jgi:hypothetical protein
MQVGRQQAKSVGVHRAGGALSRNVLRGTEREGGTSYRREAQASGSDLATTTRRESIGIEPRCFTSRGPLRWACILSSSQEDGSTAPRNKLRCFTLQHLILATSNLSMRQVSGGGLLQHSGSAQPRTNRWLHPRDTNTVSPLEDLSKEVAGRRFGRLKVESAFGIREAWPAWPHKATNRGEDAQAQGPKLVHRQACRDTTLLVFTA